MRVSKKMQMRIKREFVLAFLGHHDDESTTADASELADGSAYVEYVLENVRADHRVEAGIVEWQHLDQGFLESHLRMFFTHDVVDLKIDANQPPVVAVPMDGFQQRPGPAANVENIVTVEAREYPLYARLGEIRRLVNPR